MGTTGGSLSTKKEEGHRQPGTVSSADNIYRWGGWSASGGSRGGSSNCGSSGGNGSGDDRGADGRGGQDRSGRVAGRGNPFGNNGGFIDLQPGSTWTICHNRKVARINARGATAVL